MTITCAEHGTVLTDAMRCEACLDHYRAEYVKLSQGMNCTTALPVTPTAILINGMPGELYHQSTYIERSVPDTLVAEFEAYMDRRIAEYRATCGCAKCLMEKDHQ